MKKIVIAIFTASVFFGLNACNFLEKEYTSGSEASNFYNTTYKLQEAVNAGYNVLQSDMYNESEWVFGEGCGDDVIVSGEAGSSTRAQLIKFLFTTSNSYIKNRWEINYKGIHYVNQVIANADKVQLTRNEYAYYKSLREIVGQAKALRALFYFNLVKTYGGVPIRPEKEAIGEFTIPRSTKEEVYAYIEKDLREAIVMLPEKYSDANLGKISRGMPLFLLMKVLMYQAKPGERSEKWEEMVTLGEYFVDNQSITLGDILHFDATTQNWDSLREAMHFEPVQYIKATEPYEKPTDHLGSMMNVYSLDYQSRYQLPIKYYEQWWRDGEYCRGSIFEVDFAESKDGTSGDENDGSQVFTNLWGGECYASNDFQNLLANTKDPRQDVIILGHGGVSPEGVKHEEISVGRFACMKWYTADRETPQYTSDNPKNRRYFRYAEVVLMYAEALNECGFGSRALVQLNSNKARANSINGSSILYPACGYSYMRDNIWQERRLELAFEWDRFFDIVRQGNAATVIHKFAKTTAPYMRGLAFREGINEIFPIPQNEIDLSNGVVTQNPGY